MVVPTVLPNRRRHASDGSIPSANTCLKRDRYAYLRFERPCEIKRRTTKAADSPYLGLCHTHAKAQGVDCCLEVTTQVPNEAWRRRFL